MGGGGGGGSLNGAFLGDICPSSFQGGWRQKGGEGPINQILGICFTASQCKSRLLLGRTAGELETNSLGLSVQPEPDCSCTTSDQPARIHLE